MNDTKMYTGTGKKKKKFIFKKILSPSLVPSRLETFKYFKRKKMDIPE